MTDFALLITAWYRRNKRDLPWRHTNDPYKIWLSEIMLQQTRVAQGLSYYEKFTTHFPKIADLANADEQLVLNLWQGLGYYSRARNLHAAAKQVMEDFDGVFPNNYKDIKSLKGVGDYTAAAIASFGFNLPHAVVDGNVYRLLSRYFNDATPIDSSAGKKKFAAYADELKKDEIIAEFNQAMMEMGALICTPKNPNCEECPLSKSCEANKEGSQLILPVKSKKTKVVNRYLNYLVLDDDYVVRKREEKGIWQNMYDFPMVEFDKSVDWSVVAKSAIKKYGAIGNGELLSEDKHILSHQKLNVKFWRVTSLDTIPDDYKKVESLEDYPISRLLDRFLEGRTEYGDKKMSRI